MTIPRKGLQDMRTLSGFVDQVRTPYRAFMRVSCLEMEKFRRGKERDSAIHRVDNIDARFGEIDKEKTALLQGLGMGAGPRPSGRPAGESPGAKRRAERRFKIRY